MTPGDLEILIQQGEGTTLEFKENLSSSFARELAALANTIGGRILLGVRDDGTVTGVTDSNVLHTRIQNIARYCDPPVKALVEPVDGRSRSTSGKATPSRCSAARVSSGVRAR